MRAFALNIEKSNILNRLKIEPKKYILVTAHRSENVDNPLFLSIIFNALKKITEHFQYEIIFPMHPRTKSKLNKIEISKSIRIMDALGFMILINCSRNHFAFFLILELLLRRVCFIKCLTLTFVWQQSELKRWKVVQRLFRECQQKIF